MNVTTSSSKITHLFIPSGKYSVKLAGNAREVHMAQRLRFEVFNLELAEGLASSYLTGRDEDEYDSYCDHLIVVENATQQVIGTYRIQDREMADRGKGFYTGNEFDLSLLPEQIRDNAIELGRACIHPDHRNGRVLYMLWKGIAQYLRLAEKQYLFGCCSVSTLDLTEGHSVYQFLKLNGHLHPDIDLPVRSEYRIPECPVSDLKSDPELPKLFQLYLDIGVKVCSGPALDREFKTTDFLILLDKEHLSPSYKALFLV